MPAAVSILFLHQKCKPFIFLLSTSEYAIIINNAVKCWNKPWQYSCDESNALPSGRAFLHIVTQRTVFERKWVWQKLFGTQSDARNVEILSRAKLSTTSKFAAAGHVPWTAVTIIFAGAEILKIGRNYPKLKKWWTITDQLDSEF